MMERSEKIDRFLRQVFDRPSYNMVVDDLKHDPNCGGANLETIQAKRTEVLLIGDDRFMIPQRVETTDLFVECRDCHVKERYYL